MSSDLACKGTSVSFIRYWWPVNLTSSTQKSGGGSTWDCINYLKAAWEIWRELRRQKLVHYRSLAFAGRFTFSPFFHSLRISNEMLRYFILLPHTRVLRFPSLRQRCDTWLGYWLPSSFVRKSASYWSHWINIPNASKPAQSLRSAESCKISGSMTVKV